MLADVTINLGTIVLFLAAIALILFIFGFRR